DDTSGDRQPQANLASATLGVATLALGKTVEDRLELVFRHTWSTIRHDKVCPTRLCRSADGNLRTRGHDAQRVLEEVGQHLQDGHSIGAYRQGVWIDVADKPHLTTGGLTAHPLQTGFNQ